MKSFVFSLLFSLVSLSLMAVPAYRQRRIVTLEDGTFVTVILLGDEHYSWLQTDDGRIVESSMTVPGRYVLSQRTVEEERQTAARCRVAAYEGMHKGKIGIGSQETAALPAKGSPKVPVVLVNFADSVFTVADTDEGVREYYDLYCNGTRDGKLYRDHGSYGAIRDYFAQQSDSLFLPEFVVIGPVTLDHPASYYGENYGEKGKNKDKNYQQFCSEAVTKATAIYDGEWKDFDNRGKSTEEQVNVDMVFFIFAGYGEANGGAESSLWPKESTSSVTINNICFSTSACCNEARMAYSSKAGEWITAPDGIGIMCHELSHALGLPDFYDTNYKAFGMDIWSLMDYGCHAGNGACPVAYTAYERDFMGWRPLETLTENGFYTLTPIAADGIGYKIVNEENPDEYYILENRQRTGWDMSMGSRGHGLQVTHVDFLASKWNSNSVNTDINHQRMTIIAANNLYYGTSDPGTDDEEEATRRILETWAGNLYPFRSGEMYNDSLTANSVPAATVYTKSGYMNKDINMIRENADLTVSFYFGNDYRTAVNDLKVESTPVNQRLFDLVGRRVVCDRPRAGLYIVGGRKVLIR